MALRISKSDALPPETLARLVEGVVRPVRIDHLAAGKRIAILGVPAAFTPAPKGGHLPSFVATAPALKASGYDLVICVCANDPWVVERWAREIDPDGHVLFLSDGNLEFARALGMQSLDRRNFLGTRSRRYLMICEDGIVKSIKIEASISLVSRVDEDTFLIEA